MRILPTHVRIFDGNSENISATRKKNVEKIRRINDRFEPSGRIVSIPTVNDVVAHLGIAKKGPIDR